MVRREPAGGRPLEALREPIAPDIAVGDRDRILWPWQGDRAAQLLPGARLVRPVGCGHLPTFDDPEQVARLMLEATGATTRPDETGAAARPDATATAHPDATGATARPDATGATARN